MQICFSTRDKSILMWRFCCWKVFLQVNAVIHDDIDDAEQYIELLRDLLGFVRGVVA